jgi:signal peptidase I
MPRWLQIILVGRNPRWTLVRILVLVVAVFSTAFFILRPIRVTGPSMMPTYEDGKVNFLNRLAYKFHEPRRGDIVAIRYAGPSVLLMKRVVGLPGETVEFIDGKLFIDGKPLDEPYVKFPCKWDRAPRKLTENEYFVVGDNRSMPIADHYFGAAERERILGKILL